MIKKLFVMIVLLISVGCAEEKHSASGKLSIVCTTGMVGDLVKTIAGGHAEVSTLMGPGVDPHFYKASKGDVERLAGADLIFYNGLYLEGKMQEIFERMERTKKVVPVSRDIPHDQLRQPPEFAGHHDPHIWFDVSLWKEAVGPVVAALSEVRPEMYADFKIRGEAYRAKLDTLHHWVYKEVQSVPEKGRVLVTAHDAFGYYGRAYGVKVVGLQGISTVAEYGVTDVIRMVDLIVGSGVKAIFVESSVPERSIHAVLEGCKDRGSNVVIGGTLYSDAMGAPGSGADTYVGMVQTNTRTIVEALR
ncbi:MAG: zinc ABC transporter substrate-binding protein [Candidatus Latescibacterota bacterium]|nr:zinc ABC transporter substrate-binding protein [Candidatus Latescibacterota bacterium]